MATFKTLTAWNSIWDRVASVIGGNFTVESPFGAGPLVIDEPLTLYVETTGSDSNPGTAAKPFLTVQAALNYLKPFLIAAVVQIRVGIGTFDGFSVPDIKIQNRGNITGSLSVIGTMGLATLSTGSATGTATSTSANTVNDTGQSWTSSELIGKYSLSGTIGVNELYNPIVSATSTSFVAVTTSGTTYGIYEPLTVIVNNCRLAGTSSANTCVVLGMVQTVSIQRMKLETSGVSGNAFTNNGIAGHSTSIVEVTLSLPSAGASTTGIVLFSGGKFSASRCVFDLKKAASTAISVSAGSVTVSFSYVKGADKTQNCFVYSVGGAATSADGVGAITTSSVVFDNLKSVIAPVSVFCGPIYNSVISGLFINCDIICNTIRGQAWFIDIHANQPSFPFASSGNNTFILIDKNATVQVYSSVPSGLATTDISVNGATSTLAAMRALTPKVFPAAANAYGSYVYE